MVAVNRPGNELIARCENRWGYGDEEVFCTGRLRFRWGMSQAACGTCGAWCGIAVAEWLEVVPGRTETEQVAADDSGGMLRKSSTCPFCAGSLGNCWCPPEAIDLLTRSTEES